MADVVTSTKRSEMMSGIRGKDTKPEIIVRKGLFARGFRFRLHVLKLPGKPDIVLPKYKTVILVNGCFWHGHNCSLFKWPSSRKEFWQNKIQGTKQRDLHSIESLRAQGWRVLLVWECSMKGTKRWPNDQLIDNIERWILGKQEYWEIGEKNV